MTFPEKEPVESCTRPFPSQSSPLGRSDNGQSKECRQTTRSYTRERQMMEWHPHQEPNSPNLKYKINNGVKGPPQNPEMQGKILIAQGIQTGGSRQSLVQAVVEPRHPGDADPPRECRARSVEQSGRGRTSSTTLQGPEKPVGHVKENDPLRKSAPLQNGKLTPGHNWGTKPKPYIYICIYLFGLSYIVPNNIYH